MKNQHCAGETASATAFATERRRSRRGSTGWTPAVANRRTPALGGKRRDDVSPEQWGADRGIRADSRGHPRGTMKHPFETAGVCLELSAVGAGATGAFIMGDVVLQSCKC